MAHIFSFFNKENEFFVSKIMRFLTEWVPEKMADD